MGLDSLELVCKIEQEFEIEFLNEEAEEMQTVGDIFELILAKKNLVKQDETTARTKVEKHFAIYERLKHIIIDHAEVEAKEVTYHASITRDLGLD